MHLISKYVLNHLLHNGILKVNHSTELINKIAEKLEVDSKDIKRIIAEINQNITKHLFRIDLRTCEITGDEIYTIVNKSIDDLSSTTAGVEFEYLEAIFNEIMLSNAKYISSIRALNLTNQLRGNISKDNAQLKLDAWFENGYLIQENGLVFLGPRAISEFEEYFKGQFNERMTKCQLCTDYVYFGKICASCNEVIHKHCAAKHLKRNNCCPVCKKEWVEAKERNEQIASSDDNNTDDDDTE